MRLLLPGILEGLREESQRSATERAARSEEDAKRDWLKLKGMVHVLALLLSSQYFQTHFSLPRHPL